MNSAADDEIEPQRHVLRLYVTGSTPRSMRAIENLRRTLEAELPNRYDLEVVDVYLHPEAALEHQILAAPTLIKVAPEPTSRVIGDLSDTDRLLQGLDIQPVSAQPKDPIP